MELTPGEPERLVRGQLLAAARLGAEAAAGEELEAGERPAGGSSTTIGASGKEYVGTVVAGAGASRSVATNAPAASLIVLRPYPHRGREALTFSGTRPWL